VECYGGTEGTCVTREDLIAMYNEGFDEVMDMLDSLPRSIDIIKRVHKIKQQQIVNQELDRRINPPILPHTPLCVQIKEIY